MSTLTGMETSKRQRLLRDQRLQIQTLRSTNMTYEAIARYLQVTQHAVQYACSQEHITPSKNVGRTSCLIDAQVEELIEYVCLSKLNRHILDYN